MQRAAHGRIVTTVLLAFIALLMILSLTGCSGDQEPPVPLVDGAALYVQCSGCHGENGTGLAGVYPPLAGSPISTGPPSIPIRIVLGGLEGPITVNGERFDGAMSPWGGGAELTDAEVAAVLTYVRSSWGNAGSAVTPADVARERPSVAGRVALWTAAELGIR